MSDYRAVNRASWDERAPAHAASPDYAFARFVEDQRLGPLEVGVVDDEQAVRAGVVQGPEHRVALTQEQPSAGPQQPGHDVSPPPHVGQPAQCADPGEHQVEGRRLQRLGRRVHVGLHEVDVRTAVLGESASLGQRGCGEVEPGHPRAQPGQ